MGETGGEKEGVVIVLEMHQKQDHEEEIYMRYFGNSICRT